MKKKIFIKGVISILLSCVVGVIASNYTNHMPAVIAVTSAVATFIAGDLHKL